MAGVNYFTDVMCSVEICLCSTSGAPGRRWAGPAETLTHELVWKPQRLLPGAVLQKSLAQGSPASQL